MALVQQILFTRLIRKFSSILVTRSPGGYLVGAIIFAAIFSNGSCLVRQAAVEGLPVGDVFRFSGFPASS
jgi:hypothetical protein